MTSTDPQVRYIVRLNYHARPVLDHLKSIRRGRCGTAEYQPEDQSWLVTTTADRNDSRSIAVRSILGYLVSRYGAEVTES